MCDIDYRLLTGELDLPVNKISKKRRIIDTVCQHKNTTFKDINVKSRNKDLVYARQLCMYFLLENKYSLASSGAVFDKYHATALHAKKTINNLSETDREVLKDIDQIKLKLAYQNE